MKFLKSPFGWFLISLILLGLPGLILVTLYLLGHQNAVNGWLKDHLNLSYHLSLPLWAGLILLILPLLLLLLYFLKLKRQPLAVPSTFLWRKTIEDTQVNSLFQWLKRNLLLLLQLATLFVLLYALLAPRLFGEITSGRRYILLIDNSASMAATDTGSSRLERAKEEALKEIEAHTDDDYGMIIVFNSRATVLQSYTNDRQRLRRAVEGIEQTHRPTRINEALLQADGQANPLRTTDDSASRPAGEEPGKERTYVAAEGIPAEVHLFSDGGFPDVPDFALGQLNLHYHAIGEENGSTNNVAIVSLAANRSEDNAEELEVFGRAHNYRGEPIEVKAQLEIWINGELRGLRETLPNGTGRIPGRKPLAQGGFAPGEGVISLKVPGIQQEVSPVLRLRLKGVKDLFPLDDEAWLVAGVVRRAQVLMVGPENRFLESFFKEAEENRLAIVERMSAEDLKTEKYRRPAQLGKWDLILFDRCAPESEEDLPFANAFFIDSVPPPWKREKMPALANPQIRGWAARHPLMQDLTGLADVLIRDAFYFDLRGKGVPRNAPRLLEIDQERAVLFTLPFRSFTHLVMTFPLIKENGQWNTSWPFRLSFLLFMRNVLLTLGNVGGKTSIQAGEMMVIRPEQNVTEIRVLDPLRKETRLKRGSRTDFLYEKTERTGVYRAIWNGRVQHAFAVNLLDSQESDLTPRRAIGIGAEQITTSQPRQQARDLWKMVAVGAFLLLLVEWYFYNRR